jgi:Tfp pilus assembly protein PilF
MIATHVQIALTVRGGLVRALGGSLTDPTPEPHNDEAYELYLRSSAIPYDPEPNPQATAMLEHAVALDPNYAPAWISLSRRYYVDAHHGSGDLTMLDRSIDAAERAVALDPNDVTSLATLTTIGVERGDLLGAHRRAADLVRRRPDNVNAQFMMSYVFRYAGLLDESAAHCERAFLIDPQPLNTTLRTCAVVHFVRGGFTHALTYLNLDLETETGKAFRIDSLVREGNIDAALAIGVPQIPQWNAKYTMLFACMRGRPESEIAQLARAVQPVFDSEENYLSAGHLSYCGQTEAAANMLRRAIEGNYCSYPAMESDALFNALRAHPEYPHIRAAGRECQQRFLAARALQQG